MLAAILFVLSIGLVQSFETVSKTHFANLKYSMFTGMLYDNTESVCFTDKDHPTNGYIEKFADSSNPYYETKIGSLIRNTVEANISSSSIYYSIAAKSMEQRVQLSGLNGQPDDLLFSVLIGSTAGGAANTYDITINFKQTACSQTFNSTLINNVTTFSKNLTCPTGVTGNANASVMISYFVSYACNFGDKSVTAVTTSPMIGLRVDWNYTLQPGSVFRALFPESGYSYPAEQALNFKDLYQTLEYALQFEKKDPASSSAQLLLSQSEFKSSISFVDPGCVAITGIKCTQCASQYSLVNGECLCNKNGTILDFRIYPVQIPISDTVNENSIYFQDVCRPLGQGLDQNGLNCETQMDYFLKRKIFLRLNRTDIDSGILNITFYNSDLSINDIAKSCAGFEPTLNVYLDHNKRPLHIGRNSMSRSIPILENKKPDLSKLETVYTVPIADLANSLPTYCKHNFLPDTRTVMECQLWAVLGPGTKKTSIDYFFDLHILNSTTAAKKGPLDLQLINQNYTKPYYDSLYKSDSNIRTRVFTYNKSDENMNSDNYDNRFVVNTFGRFEKNQIVRFVFEIANLTMTQRYKISDWKKTLVISDSVGSQPYLGDTCNATMDTANFFQKLYIDCTYSLKNNISLTFDITLARQDVSFYPDTVLLSQTFMFEAYQNKEKIVLAGLSKTATIVVIVIILLLMTAAMCWLALKAGAGEHIEELTKTVKEGVTKGVDKAKEAYKKTKNTIKETYKEEKQRSKEMRKPLLEDEEDPKDKKKKAAKGKDNSKELKNKKKKADSDDDDDNIIPESLKKNDISAIKPVKDKRSDSQEDIFEDPKKTKKAKPVLDSEDDEDDTPQKYVAPTKVTESKPATPLTDPKMKMDDFKFDSQEKQDDSEDDPKKKPKKKGTK